MNEGERIRGVVEKLLEVHHPVGTVTSDVACFDCDQERWPQGFNGSWERNNDGEWANHFLAMLDEECGSRPVSSEPSFDLLDLIERLVGYLRTGTYDEEPGEADLEAQAKAALARYRPAVAGD